MENKNTALALITLNIIIESIIASYERDGVAAGTIIAAAKRIAQLIRYPEVPSILREPLQQPLRPLLAPLRPLNLPAQRLPCLQAHL